MEKTFLEKYDFFISKTLYNIIALIGFLLVLFTGYYYGYTFHENQQYFYQDLKEINAVKYLNNNFVYNFIPDKNITYAEQIKPKIISVVFILALLGVICLEIGYRMSNKYKYDKPLSYRLKEFIQKIKKADDK